MSITGLAGMYNINKLIPDLRPPDELFAGQPAQFQVSIQNNRKYLPSFLVSLTASNESTQLFPLLAPQSLTTGFITLTFPQRGSHSIGRLTISSPYPVGFFTRYWTYEISREIVVFPSLLQAAIPYADEQTITIGAALQRSAGTNGELERIYPYSGAEPLRMIHWKHSARSQDLLVKGFGSYVAAPLLLSLDDLEGEGIEERLSHAAWLITRWVTVRPVGLIIAGRTIKPAGGYRHGLQLLRELALYDRN